MTKLEVFLLSACLFSIFVGYRQHQRISDLEFGMRTALVICGEKK